MRPARPRHPRPPPGPTTPARGRSARFQHSPTGRSGAMPTRAVLPPEGPAMPHHAHPRQISAATGAERHRAPGGWTRRLRAAGQALAELVSRRRSRRQHPRIPATRGRRQAPPHPPAASPRDHWRRTASGAGRLMAAGQALAELVTRRRSRRHHPRGPATRGRRQAPARPPAADPRGSRPAHWAIRAILTPRGRPAEDPAMPHHSHPRQVRAASGAEQHRAPGGWTRRLRAAGQALAELVTRRRSRRQHPRIPATRAPRDAPPHPPAADPRGPTQSHWSIRGDAYPRGPATREPRHAPPRPPAAAPRGRHSPRTQLRLGLHPSGDRTSSARVGGSITAS
jgi:hypothetical protein